MKKKHNIKHLVTLLFFALLLLGACDSQKRVTKALRKLEQSEDYKKTRSWPQNYTFGEYSEQLDEAKIRKAFYEKRKTQAHIAKDKKTTETMENNITQYDKTIARLKKDRKFYRIYKLRSKEVEIRIKEETKIKQALEKQKAKLDRKEMRKNKDKLREARRKNKIKQQIINNKRKELKKRKEQVLKSKKEHLKTIENKKKEIARLEKLRAKAPLTAQSSYTDQIQYLQTEIKMLQGKSNSFEAPLKSIENEIALPDSVLQQNISTPEANN